MKLSNYIESGLDSVLKGLDYDLSLDYVIKDNTEFENYGGHTVRIITQGGTKYKGEIIDSTDKSVKIRYFINKGKVREPKDKFVAYSNIKEARVYQDNSSDLDDDKMKSIIDSKISTFKDAKELLNLWVNSEHAPSIEKISTFVERLIVSGDKAIGFLREALAHNIDYEELDPHRFHSAIKAKPVILKGILELKRSLVDLRNQHEAGQYNFKEKEFEVGFPERFAKGEFFPKSNYYTQKLNKDKDAVMICPFSTKGEIITLQDLNIQLPKPPKDKTKILFHDLPKKEQYWRRTPPPKGINVTNQDSFAEYIIEEFRRRREGVWFMNNGKKVYLTGNHYFALQWCQMLDDGGYMNFRYAQLEMFYHAEACIVDPRCFGQLFLKSRRTGFTYMALFILLNMSTSKSNAKYGMTSKTGDDVKEAFQKFSYAFLALPFFFRPVVKGKEDSLNDLFFGKPSDNSKEAKKARETGIEEYLNTSIDHRATTNGSYDSVKLDGYLGDEAFKWVKPNDYIVHLGMIRPTMVPNGRVVGTAFIGSTMGPREKGGKQGIDLIKGSQVTGRNEITGKTATNLYFYFLAAHKNMEEFTDKYGVCWTETPPKGTRNVYGDVIERGSIEYLLAVEEEQRSISDKALNEQYRTYPRTVEHAIRDDSESSIFNLTKLYDQLEHNNSLSKESLYTRGNFVWRDGIKDSQVVWSPNPNGRFKVAWIPSAVDNTANLANNVKEVKGKYYPLNDNVGVFGCDPYSVGATKGKGSKGGLHGLTLKSTLSGAPKNQFFLEYLEKPDEEVFFEDVIKAIRFYGMPILVESNRLDLLRHIRARGYRGFVLDRLDRDPHKLNETEKKYGGQMMSGQDIIDSHINAIDYWIECFVGKSTKPEIRTLDEMGNFPFPETLLDWINFDPKNRTEHDATISSGLAIMAAQREKYKGKPVKKDNSKYVGLLKQYSNKGSVSTSLTPNGKKQDNYIPKEGIEFGKLIKGKKRKIA